jgi:RHS repeat-associated protein
LIVMSLSLPCRTLASVLATLLFWAPLAPRVRAQEDEQARDRVESAAAELAQARDRRAASAAQALKAAKAEGSKQPAQKPAQAGAPPEEPAPTADAPADGWVDRDFGPLLANLTSGPGKNAVTAESIALPKGEGSIEGMGESFTPNLSSGTGTFSVPIALPPGRNGVQPSLTLAYSTSAGNGALGIGWSLAVPFISRQTDKGLPRYVDRPSWHAEEDTFMYNGGQELVPVSNAEASRIDGAPVPAELSGWPQYRARVEGAFMRFFRAPDASRWAVQAKDGTLFEFGAAGSGAPAAVERDPDVPQRIYSWYLARMSDVHGASVHYRYFEDGHKLYLESVYYTEPAHCAAQFSPQSVRACSAQLSDYAHRVHFVYELRADMTSSYVSTWRMEQTMRLKRIEVTSADQSVGARYLVRRYHLAYEPGSYHSLLGSVQVEGRPAAADDLAGMVASPNAVSEEALGDALVGQLLPPMLFGYSQPPSTHAVAGFGGIDVTVRSSAASPDVSADESRVALFDVNADGLPDVLVTDPARYEGGAGVYFNGFGADGLPSRAGAFSRAVRVEVPHGLDGTLNLANLNIVPMDVDGDGRSDVLHMPRRANYGYFVLGKQPSLSGYRATQGWSFHYVTDLLPQGVTDPRIDLGKDAQSMRTLDVNNDHLIDVVRTTGSATQTWLNLGRFPGGEGRFGSASWRGDSWVLSTEPSESCVLHAGRALDFGEAGLRIADMNGDGLSDLVRLSEHEVVWWPGRGPGVWGDGPSACAAGIAAGRELRMGAVPDLGSELSGVELMDVNADGADDLVQVGFDTLSVWFNQGGAAFSPRLVATDTPFAVDALDRVRIADIDGTSTADIVFADSGRWRWIDPMGGVRPRLLTSVDNGLGALTTLEYSSSAVDYLRDLAAATTCDPSDLDCFTWQREPRAPGEREAGCDALVARKSGSCAHRGFGSPVISNVVRRVRTSDRLHLLGAEETVADTEYRYHDAYYEGIEQEFRGFGAADAIAHGDAYEPTSFTRSYFHQGQRPTPIASDRLADNPNEALKGREFSSELFDERGIYLRSSHSTYAVRTLLPGLNGVAVSFAYVKSADEYRYDTALAAQRALASVQLASVQREAASSGLTSYSLAPAQAGDAPHTIKLRHDTYAHLRTTIDDVDNAGNLRGQTAWGRGGRGEFGELVADERIVNRSVPVRIDDSACGGSGWLWRTAETFLEGADGARRYQHSIQSFTACGDQRLVVRPAELDAAGFHFASPASPSYVQSDAQEVASVHPDAWGQPQIQCGGADYDSGGWQTCLRMTERLYDAAYGQLVRQESTATGRAAGAPALLSTTATWDRGLGVLRTSIDPNGYVSEVVYDGLGRLSALYLPNVDECAGAHVPTVRIGYEITPSASTRPLSRVTSTTILSCGAYGHADGQLVTHAFVDGAGRTRVTLSEGDDNAAAWADAQGHAWTLSGRQLLSAKGNPHRVYQPGFYDGTPDAYGAILNPPATPYIRVLFDAFGRPVVESNEDNTFRTRSYHALSTDLCDEVDNGATCGEDSRFARTCTTERTDGHGRAIDQQLRQRTAEGVDENHRLFSYYRADGKVTRLLRALTGANVLRPEADYAALTRYIERRFHYDSLGRRIASEDPDTDNRAQNSLATRTWRYLYNAVGDLSAVRDPRGCGQNFYYDLAGRLLGEAYVGCSEAQAGELASVDVPAGSVGLALTSAATPVHVRYHFDGYPAWASGQLSASAAGVLGRPTGVTDRGQRSVVAYDPRGNIVRIAKQLAVLAGAASVPATLGSSALPAASTETGGAAGSVVFDAAHTYVRSARFDHAGRNTESTLPNDPDFDGTAPLVQGRLHFHRGGAPRRAELGIDGRFRPVVDSVAYTRDGLPARTLYGDGSFTGRAGTESGVLYDVRRRPAQMYTTREPAAGRLPQTLADVAMVVDQRLEWDDASNLCLVEDRRQPGEWPARHKPYTRSIRHDALYRVTGVEYSYATATSSDESSDFRAESARRRLADPMRPEPAPMLASPVPERVMSLAYSHDWLANMTSWVDDAHQFYERSLGTVTNGVDLSSGSLAPERPSALYLAANLDPTTPADLGGWLETSYGAGGNLLSMTVHARCTHVSATSCTDPGGENLSARKAALRSGCACTAEQHYIYRWDELNRLHEARRYDRAAQAPWQLAARQRYRYDGANQRSVKQSFDAGTGAARAALYVYPGDFERRGLELAPGWTSWVEAADGSSESQYLIAGARVVWKNRVHGSELVDPEQRITFAVQDLIGSTSAVIDLVSGELAEVGGFYPNGGREELLGAHDEVGGDQLPLEPAGFTGKEADEEVGLTYFGERYLVARIGRWATPDPLSVHLAGGGEAGNSYHYVSGNLLQARDPLGLQAAENLPTPDTGSRPVTPAPKPQAPRPNLRLIPVGAGASTGEAAGQIGKGFAKSALKNAAGLVGGLLLDLVFASETVHQEPPLENDIVHEPGARGSAIVSKAAGSSSNGGRAQNDAPPAPAAAGGGSSGGGGDDGDDDHGNAKTSNRGSHRYEIYRTDAQGNRELYKTGIGNNAAKSGRATLRTTKNGELRSARAQRQVGRFKGKKDGYTYSAEVKEVFEPQPAGQPTSRQLALEAEQATVNDYAATHGGELPPGMELPKPKL